MQASSQIRRVGLAAVLVLPLLAVAGGGLADGSRGAAGAAVGIAMLVVFFAGGRAPMVLANTTPAGQLFLLIAMGYVLRVVLLLAVLLAFGNAGWLDRSALALTVIVGALLWTSYLVLKHLTSHQPTLVIPAAAPPVLTPTGVAS